MSSQPIEGVTYLLDAQNWTARSRDPIPKNQTGGGDPPLPPGMRTLVLNEDWSSIDSTKWKKNGSGATYGAPDRIQTYRDANVTISAATAGGTGNSLKMLTERNGVNDYWAGSIDSRNATIPDPDGFGGIVPNGRYWPMFGWYEVRAKIPHGQGIWPAFWLRHREGSTICEVDFMEYFHMYEPGKTRSSLHRTNNSGTYQNNVYQKATFFEEPTLTPGWHIWAISITSEYPNVRFRTYQDNVLVYDYLDTQAAIWSVAKAPNPARVFDIRLEGVQIGNQSGWVGMPNDPPGYDSGRGVCASGGTAPNACNTSINGHAIWADNYVGNTLFPNTTEVDYVRVWSVA